MVIPSQVHRDLLWEGVETTQEVP